jgi:hypothetical protein
MSVQRNSFASVLIEEIDQLENSCLRFLHGSIRARDLSVQEP